MKHGSHHNGVTFVEMVMTMAISVMAGLLLWKGVGFLQAMISQQMRLERTTQVLVLTQQMARSVREAKRILAVGPDHLDLEVYDYSTYSLLDPSLYVNLKLVRYRFNREDKTRSIVQEVYASSESAKPTHSKTFLKTADLSDPTPEEPFFFASYLVGVSTIGVKIGLGLHPPFSKERWVPITTEVYVQAK